MKYTTKHITIPCLHCQTEFSASVYEVNRGYGKFCSRKCSSTYNRPVTIRQPNCVCAHCGTKFHRYETKQRLSKSLLLFCSRNCKDISQQIGGILRKYPSSDQSKSYRTLAFKAHEPKCKTCGYATHPEVLQVHHKDRNRRNNSSDNLEILCPTCHEVDHFLNGDGKWSPKSRN